MFTKFNFTRFARPFMFALVAAAMVFSALMPTATAFAQDGNPPTKEEAERRWVEKMEKAYQRELEWLEKQTERLAHTAENVEKVNNLIAKAEERGLDTSPLKTALAAYQASVADAQASHDSAAAILGAHAGFDDSGKVTDKEAARQTLADAHDALQEARHILNNAAYELREAIQQFLRDNRPE
jgi:hypothetical protein